MTYLIVNKIFQKKKKKIEKILSANATVSGIINNILYAIMHLEKFQILNKIKYINIFFFFLVKSLVRPLIMKINQYYQD